MIQILFFDKKMRHHSTLANKTIVKAYKKQTRQNIIFVN